MKKYIVWEEIDWIRWKLTVSDLVVMDLIKHFLFSIFYFIFKIVLLMNKTQKKQATILSSPPQDEDSEDQTTNQKPCLEWLLHYNQMYIADRW